MKQDDAPSYQAVNSTLYTRSQKKKKAGANPALLAGGVSCLFERQLTAAKRQ